MTYCASLSYCETCGIALDNMSSLGYCYECYRKLRQDLEEDMLDVLRAIEIKKDDDWN